MWLNICVGDSGMAAAQQRRRQTDTWMDYSTEKDVTKEYNIVRRTYSMRCYVTQCR